MEHWILTKTSFKEWWHFKLEASTTKQLKNIKLAGNKNCYFWGQFHFLKTDFMGLPDLFLLGYIIVTLLIVCNVLLQKYLFMYLCHERLCWFEPPVHSHSLAMYLNSSLVCCFKNLWNHPAFGVRDKNTFWNLTFICHICCISSWFIFKCYILRIKWLQ